MNCSNCTLVLRSEDFERGFCACGKVVPLSSCPFCGSEDVRAQYNQSMHPAHRFYMQCMACWAKGPVANTNELAHASWEHRG